MGAQSVREAKTLAIAVNDGAPEQIQESLTGITDYVNRDYKFARFLGEKDEVDFEAPEKTEAKVYTSKKGPIRELLEKHKVEIGAATLAASIVLSLSTVKLSLIMLPSNIEIVPSIISSFSFNTLTTSSPVIHFGLITSISPFVISILQFLTYFLHYVVKLLF